MSENGNNIFQACSNVQVNGGSFSISGRDTNTQTVHYHTGSASHRFGYASNVNTGMNTGHFAQGGYPGYPSPPRNNTYPGPYGSMGAPGSAPPPPTGGWNPSQNHQSYYPQYARSPPATPGPAPPSTGYQHTPGPSPVPPSSESRNPFRQNTTPASPPPRRPSPVARTSSDATQVDDVDVVDLDEVEETPSATPGASQSKSTFTTWASSTFSSYGRRE